jgi:hypothetical protein
VLYYVLFLKSGFATIVGCLFIQIDFTGYTNNKKYNDMFYSILSSDTRNIKKFYDKDGEGRMIKNLE